MNRDDFWNDPSDFNTGIPPNYELNRKPTSRNILANKGRRSNRSDKFEDSAESIESNEFNMNRHQQSHTFGYDRPLPSRRPDLPPYENLPPRNDINYDIGGNAFQSTMLNQGFPSIPANPIVADMALRYGSNIMDTGREMVDKEINKYVSISTIKNYFDVDTSYTLKKLFTIIFPFANKTWIPKSDHGPVSPREDFNAPDLYIPLMAYLTYVLLAGLVIAMKTEFRPEVLGILASQALACVLVEVVLQLITIYITNLQTRFSTYDLLAFAGYKFIGLTLIVSLRWLLGKSGYYLTLSYTGIALAFFLIRTLKWRMINESIAYDQDRGDRSLSVVHQGKRRLYLLISIALSQPILMWWLSNNLEHQLNITNVTT